MQDLTQKQGGKCKLILPSKFNFEIRFVWLNLTWTGKLPWCQRLYAWPSPRFRNNEKSKLHQTELTTTTKYQYICLTLLVPAHLPQLRTGQPAGLTLMLQAHLFSCQSLHSLLCNCTKENTLYFLQSLTLPPPPPNEVSNMHYGQHTGICKKKKRKKKGIPFHPAGRYLLPLSWPSKHFQRACDSMPLALTILT